MNFDALRRAYELSTGKATKSRGGIMLPEGFVLETDLSDDERAIYERNYKRVFDLTGDAVAAMQAGFGAVSRARYGMAVKAQRAGEGVIVAGWGIMFGSPVIKDTEETFFDVDTDYYEDNYQNAPLWLEHGEDEAAGWKKIGHRISTKRVNEFGIYVRHLIVPSEPVFESVNFEQLIADIDAGQYAYSSDSLWHYVQKGHQQETGKLQAWPLAGLSLVRRPAEPGLGPVVIRQ